MFAARPIDLHGQIIDRQWLSLASSHALTAIEQATRLGQPVILGLAVNDLLNSSYRGLAALVVLHLVQMGIAAWRRSRHVRLFGRLSADLAKLDLVGSRKVAASERLRFHQRQAPLLIRAAMAIVGVLLAIGLFDPLLLPAALALLGPVMVLQVMHGRPTLALSGRLIDQFSRGDGELFDDIDKRSRVAGEDSNQPPRHSGSESWNAVAMELLVLALLAAALVRACTQPGATPGGLVMIVRYLSMFVAALDGVPLLVAQFGKWRAARPMDARSRYAMPRHGVLAPAHAD